MKIMPFITIIALCLCAPVTAGERYKGRLLTAEQAVGLAVDFLKRTDKKARYETKPSAVSLRGDEYLVEFPDKRKYVKPGLRIVSVDRKSGDVKYVPVE